MRHAFLIWSVWFLTIGPAPAQPVTNASSVEAALIAEDFFNAIGLQFETGRSTLLPHAMPVLDAVGEVLVRHPSLRLEIAGHTDALGSSSLNVRLSEERARSVKAYLMVRHRIDTERLETTGYGASVPIASNENTTGRALNRRVEFRVINPDALRGASIGDRPQATPRPVNADSLRDALQRQVDEAVRDAIAEAASDSTELARVAELEMQLQERLARLDRELAADSVVASPPPVMGSGFALLPFTGIYLHGDVPVLLGIRADIPTALFGSTRFQPEAALGFMPNERATIVNANLVFPIRIGSYSDVLPFFGAGVGFHNLEGVESVLNLLIGVEQRFDFGVLFAELMTQDFSDFNRVIVGFRQDF